MKKIFGYLLLMMALVLGVAACGGESLQVDIPKGEVGIKKEEEVISWVDSHTNMKYSYDEAIVRDGIVYGYYLSESGITVICEAIQNNCILRETTIEGAVDALSMTVDNEGDVYVLGSTEAADMLWKVNNNGEVINVDNFALEDVDDRFEVLLKGFFVDDNGKYYLWCETTAPLSSIYEEAEENVYTLVDRIYVKDNQLNTLFYEQIPNSGGTRLLNFAFDNEGVPSILAEDEIGLYMQKLSDSLQKDISKERMEGISGIEELENVTIIEGGFLYSQGGGLYKYSIADNKVEKLLELSSVGILSSGILYLGMQEDIIEIVDNYSEQETSEYLRLSKGACEKLQLTLGTMQVSPDLEIAVTGFNRFNDDIRVDIITYYDEEKGFEEGVEQLKLDLVRGEAPDILEVSILDCDMLAKKGVFVDLYKYMEEDKECNKEVLVPGILTSYESNGHLYSIAPTFQLFSMWGSGTVIQGRCGVNIKEFIQILENFGRDINAIYGFSADEPVLTTLCAMGMDEFVDWENRTCNFEGEDFKALLEFSKEYSGSFTEGSLSKGIQNGDILITTGIISEPSDLQVQCALYGDMVDFIGYPTVKGTGTAVGYRGSQVAINANGQNKDAAWEFVKYYVLNGYLEEGFPIVKEQFEESMIQAMTEEYVSTSEGEQKVINRVYQDENVCIEINAATQEVVDAIKAMIEVVDGKFAYHTEIQNIINEEVESYYTGQKDIDTVTSLIQNRVILYLQEQ